MEGKQLWITNPNLDLGTQNILILNVKCITEQKEGLHYMYPNGFNTENFTNRAILACTNTQVDEWNNIIQCMNPSFNIHGNRQYCLSRDILAEVDDLYDMLKEILVPEVLNTFIKTPFLHTATYYASVTYALFNEIWANWIQWLKIPEYESSPYLNIAYKYKH